ncbi:hypothetical protein ACFQ08_14670 [Streptosporangium algeriense]|uniref:AMP-dependent synthetase/ligase domain-containing protein n=1 Tax=Streptosporangium algeriense TaxID=1682748 RepID=A0ABW3DPJ1_9ACTN
MNDVQNYERDQGGTLYDPRVREAMTRFAEDDDQLLAFEASAAVRTAYHSVERMRAQGSEGRGVSAGALDLLIRLDARFLITTPGLAESSLQAADVSRVRQVIAFGQARDTVDFADLLLIAPAPLPSLDPSVQPALRVEDGDVLTHEDLIWRMCELDKHVMLEKSDVLLVTWPLTSTLPLTTLIGLALMRGSLVVVAPSLAAQELSATIHDFGVTVLTLLDGAVQRV